MPVPVPEVVGLSPDEAEDQLRASGLVPDVQERNDLIDEILGGDLGACGTEPKAGTRVFPGTTVVVEARNGC